jgi:uncharacterized membrane protein YbhN (UPF0104 family)
MTRDNHTLHSGEGRMAGGPRARESSFMAAIGEHSPITARVSRRQLIVLGVSSAVLVAGLVVIAPALAGLPDVWRRISHGDPWWLAIALVMEALSFVGHIVLFRAVSLDGSGRIGMRASTEITLAGHMATRLLASAGAGGIALTAWALKRSGMEARDVAARMTTFLVLLYAVYMGALVIGGVGLATGLLHGGGSAAITLIPAAFGALVIAIVASAQLVEPGASRLRRGLAPVGAGVREARRLVRAGNPGLLGAIMWWGFDIATLWACFHAYGPDPPPFAVIVLGYFVGMLGNALPLPGGIGGVDGGMIGAFAALGVSSDYAISAVLTYRAFAFWLPTLPGAIAYFQLRRRVATWREEHRAAKATAVAQA